MKVLFVTPFYEPAWIYGGIARASVDWAHALSAAGVAVSVFTTAVGGEWDLDLPLGIPLDRDGIQETYFPHWRKSGKRFGRCRRFSVEAVPVLQDKLTP